MISFEKRVSNQFGGFCTRVLKNESYDIDLEFNRNYKNIKSLEMLSHTEERELSQCDSYFEQEYIFDALDNQIIVVGEPLIGALKEIHSFNRTIILLSYFLNMDDGSIAKLFGVVKQNIQYRRKAALRQLKTILIRKEL